MDGFLRLIRHGKELQARRVERYAYLRAHKAEREREIDAALQEGDMEKLREVLKKWSFDVSTFSEVGHGRN